MPLEYDIVIETANRTRVLVAECRQSKVTSATEVASWRRSLQDFTRDPISSYFMLVFPTALFLWKEDADANAEPQLSAAANPVLKRYLGAIADKPDGPLAESLEMAIAFEGVTRVMTNSVETEAVALDGTIRRILDCADIIPLADEILGSSFGARKQFALQPQDSVIFASVDWYLNKNAKRESIFANRNSNDFAVPGVKAHFGALNCKVRSTFSDAVGRIQHRAKAH